MGRFDPKTEAEASGVLPDGEYEFKIVKAEETKRKKTGALMFAIEIECYGKDDEKRTVSDWIGTDYMHFRLRHFCYSIGMGDEYEKGEVYGDDLVDRLGKAKLKAELDDDYGYQNRVIDYIVPHPGKPEKQLQGVPASQTRNAQRSDKEHGTEDDVPF